MPKNVKSESDSFSPGKPTSSMGRKWFCGWRNMFPVQLTTRNTESLGTRCASSFTIRLRLLAAGDSMNALDRKINDHFAGPGGPQGSGQDGQGQRHRADLRAGIPAGPVLRHLGRSQHPDRASRRSRRSCASTTSTATRPAWSGRPSASRAGTRSSTRSAWR